MVKNLKTDCKREKNCFLRQVEQKFFQIFDISLDKGITLIFFMFLDDLMF